MLAALFSESLDEFFILSPDIVLVDLHVYANRQRWTPRIVRYDPLDILLRKFEISPLAS
jgi:hypothetical protein